MPRNYPLFMWNTNLTFPSEFLFAQSGNVFMESHSSRVLRSECSGAAGARAAGLPRNQLTKLKLEFSDSEGCPREGFLEDSVPACSLCCSCLAALATSTAAPVPSPRRRAPGNPGPSFPSSSNTKIWEPCNAFSLWEQPQLTGKRAPRCWEFGFPGRENRLKQGLD